MYRIEDRGTPVITVALHAGHEVRPSLLPLMALPDDERLREEDPFTDVIADIGVTRVVAQSSRFEVDLNRTRDEAVYLTPEMAWGLEVWRAPIDVRTAEESRRIHDAFRASVGEVLDRAVQVHGGFVVLDVHSYNHRRGGPEAPPAHPATDPEINLGTESVDTTHFGSAIATLRSAFAGEGYDVAENVKFRGGAFVRWINARYEGVGCGLAIEFKKTFMDEWTGTPDPQAIERARATLASAADALAATFGGGS